jgi:prepilin-type N-terminal cleavage/methylation domain-containing protein
LVLIARHGPTRSVARSQCAAPSPQRGFSLVELLTVIAIIVALLGMLFPALVRAKEATRRTKCLTSIRHMGVIAIHYATANKGWFPPAIRKHKGSLHLGYATPNVYEAFSELADDKGQVMTCPSNPEPPRHVGEGTPNDLWITTIRYMAGWDCTIGSYFQGPSGDFWPGGDLPYFSPIKIHGRGGNVMFADSVYRQPHWSRTSGNHGPPIRAHGSAQKPAARKRTAGVSHQITNPTSQLTNGL